MHLSIFSQIHVLQYSCYIGRDAYLCEEESMCCTHCTNEDKGVLSNGKNGFR